ncbi:TPA: hypothetical protein N0F65_004126, partial [Lagenidium giganteum]
MAPKRREWASMGLCASKPEEYSTLPVSKAIQKCDGVDITKKNTARKGKFLFAFPGVFGPVDQSAAASSTEASQALSPNEDGATPAPASSPTTAASAQRLGTLAQLDTLHPVLYLEFPGGRLKMEGEIIYPKNKYLTIQFSRSGKHVVCQDSFDKLVVFPKVYWIGTAESNPKEKPLPIPQDITVVPTDIEAAKEQFFRGGGTYGSSAPQMSARKQHRRSTTSTPPTSARGSKLSASDDDADTIDSATNTPEIENEVSEADESASVEEGEPVVRRSSSTRRASLNAKQQFVDVLGDDDADADSDEEPPSEAD